MRLVYIDVTDENGKVLQEIPLFFIEGDSEEELSGGNNRMLGKFNHILNELEDSGLIRGGGSVSILTRELEKL